MIRDLQGQGNRTIVLVGNSHADVIARELSDELHGHFGTFHMFTMPGTTCTLLSFPSLPIIPSGCIPISVPTSLIPYDPAVVIPCPLYTQTVKKLVEQTKPDVLFMAFRHFYQPINAKIIN